MKVVALTQLSKALHLVVAVLSLAIPRGFHGFSSAADLDGCRIATSYPALTRSLLSKQGINAQTVKFSGSVEIAPGLGTADAISDLVSTGTTLRANHLVGLVVSCFESTAQRMYGQQENPPA